MEPNSVAPYFILTKNKMDNYFFIALFSSLVFFASCKNQVEEPGIEMEFTEAQCTNPWDALPGK